MASQAEIDLVVNASNTLNQLQSDLDRVVAAAQATADPVQLQAAINTAAQIARLRAEIDDIVRATQAAAPDIDIDVDVDRDRSAQRAIQGIRNVVSTAVPAVARLGASVGALGLAAGGAAPLIAGVVTAVESIIPAAAVATTGMLALVVATNTVKLAMVGVGEAIEAAFDPETTPEELEKALKRLAPEARAFVVELRGMRSQLRAVQQAVQNQFFENFDNVVRQLGRTVLPDLRNALVRVSGSFNEMTRRAAASAIALSESGVLGQALGSVTRSIQSLRDAPAAAVTGFGALAAAAGPQLEKIAARVAALADRISQDLVDAFRSGDLTKSINEAFSNLASLGRSAVNVLGGLRNVFAGLQANGRGLFETLEDITGTFRQVTGSREFQSVLGELARTAATLGNNLKIVVGPALGAVGALFEALAPSVRKVLDSLGPTLAGALEDLKPLFDGVGDAVGGFMEAASPLVDLAIELIGLIGGALGPIFATLGDIFRSMAPVLRQVADNFLAVARPILEQLGPAFEKVFPKFSEAAERIFPKVADVLARLEPGFKKLGEAVAQLLPLLAEINALIVEKVIAALEKLGPLLQPLIDKLIELASGALELVAFAIENFVAPALEIVIDLLNGDFRSALLKTIQLGRDVDKFLTAAFNSLKENVTTALRTLGNNIVNAFNSALNQARDGVNRKLAEITQFFRNLPGRIQSALGNLGTTLFNAGSAIVEGMIRGVQAKVGSLLAQLADIARRAKDTVTSVLGIASPSKEFAKIGDFMIQGIQVGIARSSDALRRDLEGLAFAMPAMAGAGAGAGSLVLPQQQAPVANVTVMIGNQILDRHIDVRMDSAFARRDRVAAQGVRF